MSTEWFKAIAATVAATLIAACGGGGGGGGIGGTGVTPPDASVGTITLLGSVWVNGVEFSTSSAVIKRDDNAVTQNELRVGMVARVDGSISKKTADTVTVNSAAKGRVEAAPTATQMVVMGQTITLSTATIFENNLRPVQGDYVEVHGQVASDGVIAAGYVEKKAFAPLFAVKGFVRNHNGNAFTIGTLNVTLAAGAAIGDMPGGSWNGLKVEVKGTTCAGNPPTTNVCTTLTANKVEPEDLQGDIAQVELESFVTAINADGFNLGAQKILTSAATVYEGGVAADLVVGAEVEVEGSLAAGVLTAAKVSFRDGVRVTAPVASVNPGAGTFVLQGFGSMPIETNASTQFASNIPNIGSITAGMRIEVRGRPVLSGSTVTGLVASEVKPGGGNAGRVLLTAPATAVVPPPVGTVTLLGILIDTSAFTDSQFLHSGNPVPIGRTAFFAGAAPGKSIKASGSLNGSTVNWNQEIELEQ